jgi:hypothetical protein
LDFHRESGLEASIALQGLLDCYFDITMVEKLSITYNPKFLQILLSQQNEDEDDLFYVPSRLFDQNAQITHTESTSEGEKTQSWSVKKGERLLRESAQVKFQNSIRELREDTRKMLNKTSQMRIAVSDLSKRLSSLESS